MSVQEVKSQLERMSPLERSELEAFLRAKRVADRPGFVDRVAEARRRMDAGDAVSAVELRAMLEANPPPAE
jgi:hypothetical protein